MLPLINSCGVCLVNSSLVVEKFMKDREIDGRYESWLSFRADANVSTRLKAGGVDYTVQKESSAINESIE